MTIYRKFPNGSLYPSIDLNFEPENLVEIDDDAIKPYKPKPKFKVGDRVETFRGAVGFVDRVLSVDANGVTYWVRFADFGGGIYAERELEKAPTLEDVLLTAIKATGLMSPFSRERIWRIADGVYRAFPEIGS